MRILILSLLLLFSAPCMVQAEMPASIAGISFGKDISTYDDIILKDTMMGNRDALFLGEVNLNPSKVRGIRGGSISFGNCDKPGKVVGIKLKFLDRSFALYEALEKEYRNTFGEPDEWLGDPFHNVISWKWVFKEGDESTEVVLTYSKDPEIRPGVSIKMIFRSQWERELQMYKAKQAKREKHQFMDGDYSSTMLTPFIPQ